MKLHWQEMEALSQEIDQDLNLGVKMIGKVLNVLNDREMLTLTPAPETVTTAAEPETPQPTEDDENPPQITVPESAETKATTSPSTEPDPGGEEGSIPF